jgi:signal transduction histidine kinase
VTPGAPSVWPATRDEGLARRIAWLTGARLIFLTLLLAFVVLFYGRTQIEPTGFTVQAAAVTLAVAYFCTAVYAIWLRSGSRLEELAQVQLILDQMTWTMIVYLSGGAGSGATAFYGLTCLAGATLTGLRGAAIGGVTAVLCYGGLVASLQRGWVVPPPDQLASIYDLKRTEAVYYVLVHVLVLTVVTLLAGYLAERLRLTGGELRRAEARAEQAERMAALGRLAAGLAHEVRNPLGSISGSIQLLRTSPALSSEDRQLCGIIQREAARLDDLVTDMLDLSRPRAIELVVLDLASVARDVVALASRSGRAQTDVNVVYDGPERVLVRGDAAMVRQMLWNLVRNSVQASSAGDLVAVRIRMRGGSVALEVEDHGIGIGEEARARIFDAFFTTRSQGTGVGLAVVKRIVDEHGYSIDVTSEQGRGATFRVGMGPATDLPSDPLAPPSDPSPSEPSRVGPRPAG